MKRYPLIFLFLASFFGCDTTSNIKQPGKNYFVKYFGEDGNQFAVGLIVNSDGTFFILGNSRHQVGALQKVYLAKADAQGNLIWQTTFGSAEIEARDFVIANGSIVVAANVMPTPGTTNVQLIRFTESGVVSDSAILQMPSSSARVNSITILNDGDFLISGNTDYVTNTTHTQDALHLRTDQNFVQRVISWANTYGPGTINNEIKGFQYTDSIYMFGNTNSSYTSPTNTDQNFWTFSLHYSTGAPDGNADDSSFVDNLYNDRVTHVLRSSLGGYLMTGISIDNNQNQNLKIVKLRNDNLAFNDSDIQLKYPGKSLGIGGTPFATTCNSSSGYLVLTNSYDIGGNSDLMLTKIYGDYNSQTLNELWKEPVLLGGDGDDTAAAVAELTDGHIIVLGTMSLGKPAEQFKIALIKLNSAGRLSD